MLVLGIIIFAIGLLCSYFASSARSDGLASFGALAIFVGILFFIVYVLSAL